MEMWLDNWYCVTMFTDEGNCWNNTLYEFLSTPSPSPSAPLSTQSDSSTKGALGNFNVLRSQQLAKGQPLRRKLLQGGCFRDTDMNTLCLEQYNR